MANKYMLWVLVALFILSATTTDPKETDIQGKYIVRKIGTIVPSQNIYVNIDNVNVNIQGCNTLLSSFTYNLSNKGFACTPFTSTKKFCANDQDSLVTKAFASSKKITRQGANLVCEDGYGKETLRLQTQTSVSGTIVNSTILPIVTTFNVIPAAGSTINVVSNTTSSVFGSAAPGVAAPTIISVNGPTFTNIATAGSISAAYASSSSSTTAVVSSNNYTSIPINQIVDPIINITQTINIYAPIQGQYDLAPASLSLQINQNTYILFGCNTHTLNIEFLGDRNVKFGVPASTLKFCQFDFDSFYLQAFSLAKYLIPVEKGYRILDQNSKLLLEIVASKTQYLVSVPSVSLTVDANTFSYEGCNIQSTEYILLGNSSIAFGQTISTLKQCLFFDYDLYIVESLQLANNFQLSAKALVLKADDNVVAIAFVKNLIPSPIFTTNVITAAPTPINIPEIPYPIFVPTPICTPVSPNDNQVIPPPVVTLPGVSSISLKGVYRLEPTDSPLSAIILIFDEDYIQFESCNLNRIPYTAYTDGTFTLLSGASATQRQCVIDNDNAYINVLRSINRFQKSDGGYIFYNDNTIVANLPNKVRNQVVKYSIIYGGYQVSIDGLDGNVANGVISFKGCNSVSIPYTLIQNGSISFGQAISTKIFCENDVDSYYTTAITASKTVQAIKQGYSLIDERGIERIRFVNFATSQQYPNLDYLCGNFKFQLPSSALKLSITDGKFALAGCNQYTFKFSLSDNGSIIFGAPDTTGKTCNVDFDKVYLYALLKAQSIVLVDKTIIFFNSNKEQVFKAINFQMSKSGDAPTVIDASNPIVKITDYKLVEGTYKFTVLRTSFKLVNLAATGKSISFKGCNTVNFNYTASSDGNITFKFIGATKIACKDDYDNFYIDALNSIRKFNQMKGMYTFFDASGKSVVTFVADASIANVVGSKPAPAPTPVNNSGVSNINSTYTNNIITVNITKPIPIPVSESIISLKGQYKLQVAQIAFEIFENSFVFKGCNTYRVPCAYKNSNIFFGSPIAANKKCSNSIDEYFLKMIANVSTFRFQNNIFTFYNNKLQSLFSAGLNLQNTRNSNSIPGLYSGSYSATLPSIDVQFDDQNFTFGGCKENGYAYKAKNTGSIAFTEPKVKRACSISYDDVFTNALKGASKWKKTESGLTLYDNEGNAKCSCTLKKQ